MKRSLIGGVAGVLVCGGQVLAQTGFDLTVTGTVVENGLEQGVLSQSLGFGPGTTVSLRFLLDNGNPLWPAGTCPPGIDPCDPSQFVTQGNVWLYSIDPFLFDITVGGELLFADLVEPRTAWVNSGEPLIPQDELRLDPIPLFAGDPVFPDDSAYVHRFKIVDSEDGAWPSPDLNQWPATTPGSIFRDNTDPTSGEVTYVWEIRDTNGAGPDDPEGDVMTIEIAGGQILLPCIADHNNDGFVAVGDILDFLSDWSSGVFTADINNDGQYSVGDILDYLAEWSSGC